MPDWDPCLFQTPHKEWANDSRERENWSEVERWSLRLKNCGSTCTCAVLEWDHTQSIPSGAITNIAIPGTTVLCGTVVTSHMFIATFNIRWDGSTAGTLRHVNVFGNGESSIISGDTAPPLNYFGLQLQNVTKFFPAHLNTLSPKYTVQVYQDSGAALNVTVRGQEHYPCCDCDWAYGC